MRYDTGDYPASVRLCAELLNAEQVRARQQRGEADGRLIGIGFASFTEQTAHGAAEFASRGASVIPGFESCTARILPDGSLVLMVGIQSHGQGLETTLSQIAAEELGIDPANIAVRHGDTESTAFGFGTFASRSMVMSGGAVARASRVLRDKVERIGAHLLQCEKEEAHCAGGAVTGPQGRSVPLAEVAKVAHLRMDGLPAGVEPLLDATATYEPGISTGVYSYATHGAVVAVDPETGAIELLDFAVAEDCGTMVNPMLVEGQIRGGVAQGIGTALWEEIPYDRYGQPLAATLMDYHLPAAFELPPIRIAHLHTPATATEYGMKGMGEGGAVAPPAAIANAVRDALAALAPGRHRGQRDPAHRRARARGDPKSKTAGLIGRRPRSGGFVERRADVQRRLAAQVARVRLVMRASRDASYRGCPRSPDRLRRSLPRVLHSVRFRQSEHALGDVRQDQLRADRGDAGDLDLAEETLDMEFARVAHAAMRQDRGLAGAVPGLGGEIFCRIRKGADRRRVVAPVIGCGRPKHQQFGRFKFDPAFRERVLDALVLADRAAEHDALAGVARGAGQRGAPEPHRLGGDQDALRVHAVQDVLEAAPLVADPVGCRGPADRR